MNNEDIKSYNNSIKISTICVIVSFFFATIIMSFISAIFSTRAYKLGKYDYKKRKKALLLDSIALFTASSMTTMRNSQNALEGLLVSILSCILFYFIMVKITNSKYGKSELSSDEEDDDDECVYVCPNCRKEVEYGEKYCRNCFTIIDWNDNNGSEDEYDEDINEDDEFFKEKFVFSYDKVKEVLKKMGYTSFATFRKEVYENKHVKRKKFDDKEKECNYLARALGYDDFEDFYNENI